MAEESPEELRQRADEVLGQPKFLADEPGLIDRAWERVTEFIDDLLSIVSDSTAFGGVAVGWIILAAMVGLIVFFLVRYLPRFGSTGTETVTAEVSISRNRRSRAEWLAEAEAADRAGLHREAVRARYRATVAGLVDDEELPSDPGTTPTELVTAFGADRSRTDPFASSTGAFSDVWYGGSDADRSDSEQLAEWDRAVVTGGGRK